MSGEIMVTDADDGITITWVDGTVTRVAVGSSIGTLTENNTPTEYAALTPGEQISTGNIGSIFDDSAEISLDKGDIDTENAASNSLVFEFTRNPKRRSN